MDRGASKRRCSANLTACVLLVRLHDGVQGGPMYLRHTTVTKNGKTRTYWRLVRSVRVGRKVRQETVAQLGELDEQGRLQARALADQLAGVEPRPGLFDDDPPSDPIPLDLRAL